jgi:hypothetical protein
MTKFSQRYGKEHAIKLREYMDSAEFYTVNWDMIKADLRDVLHQIFLHKQVTPAETRDCYVPS